MSMLDDEEREIEVAAPGVGNAAGEIKRRRGRPSGTKNKPKEESGLAVNMENAIRGLFGLLSVVAGWFGYVQTEELTEAEAKEGARAFVPIANKLPWLASVATYIGAPVWLLLMMRKKFARKATNEVGPSGNRGDSPNVVAIDERGTAATNNPH